MCYFLLYLIYEPSGSTIPLCFNDIVSTIGPRLIHRHFLLLKYRRFHLELRSELIDTVPREYAHSQRGLDPLLALDNYIGRYNAGEMFLCPASKNKCVPGKSA